MRSSQVAAEAGVNVQTLRYYERRGLLAEPQRLPSGYRAYGSDAVRRVRFVKRAQQLGFSLEEIDGLLELAAGGPRSCETARAVAADKLAELDEKISSLTVMRASLLQLIATCERPPRLRECPLLEALGSEPEVPRTPTGPGNGGVA
jgi:MerR family transcriptional regulator, mercuric resistance operon regulatory protein